MEGSVIPTTDDLCDSILSRFSTSTQEDHQHLCAVIGAMSQELKEQNLQSTPIAYFGAACSSLDRLSSSEPDPPPHVVDALLTIISLALPRISTAILKKKRELISEIVVKVLRLNSLTVGAVTSGLKCIAHMLIIKDTVSWIDVSQLYGVLLGFIIDSRPKVTSLSFVFE